MSKGKPGGPYQTFSFHFQNGDTEWKVLDFSPDRWANEVEIFDGADADYPWALVRTTPLGPEPRIVCMCEDAWEEREGAFYAMEHDCKAEPTILYGWHFEVVKVYHV